MDLNHISQNQIKPIPCGPSLLFVAQTETVYLLFGEFDSGNHFFYWVEGSADRINVSKFMTNRSYMLILHFFYCCSNITDIFFSSTLSAVIILTTVTRLINTWAFRKLNESILKSNMLDDLWAISLGSVCICYACEMPGLYIHFQFITSSAFFFHRRVHQNVNDKAVNLVFKHMQIIIAHSLGVAVILAKW